MIHKIFQRASVNPAQKGGPYLKKYVPSTALLPMIFFAVLTTGLIAGVSVFNISHRYILFIIGLDAVLLFVLGILLARRLIHLWVQKQKGLAGSKLHVRITSLFGGVALVPALSMTIFSILFFHFGIQEWFSSRIRDALSQSVAVSTSYLNEHQNSVAKDVTLMAYDLNQELSSLKKNRKQFDHYLTVMASLRSLTEAIVFNGDQDLLGRSQLTFALQFEPLPSWAMEQAAQGKVALLKSADEDRIRALIQLPGYPGIFLFVGRSVDPKVASHVKRAQDIFKEYGVLEGQRTGFEIIVIALFVVVALLLILISLWGGLLLSGKLIEPLQNLIRAAEKVRLGELSVRVPEEKLQKDDEISMLSRAFNRMTRRLHKQQSDLLNANKELRQQKQFIESTLAGVSVGVIGLDEKGGILYPNQMASQLLNLDLKAHVGQKLDHVYKPLGKIFSKSLSLKQPFYEEQVTFQIRGLLRVFLIRILFEMNAGQPVGYVITMDEITSLLDAQKQAAWADVARRVAHEIKNPLTPIHLAAERLKRKYGKEITSSPDTFDECLETIKRQVNYIGNMVSEFSAFARMPKPKLKKENLAILIDQVINLHKDVSDVTFSVNLSKDLYLLCDAQQISQALLNIFKNSLEAMTQSKMKTVTIMGCEEAKSIVLTITDTGPGFPEELAQSVLDPYVTTKAEGTGLGLSIVKRILEEHNGTLEIGKNKKPKGACIILTFPKVK